MQHSFNPVNHTISPIHKLHTPPSLQQSSRNVVLSAISLKRLSQAVNLPIPRILSQSVSRVTLSDFLIKLEDLTRENYITCTYPATCLFNKSRVTIKVVTPGYQEIETDKNHPGYLTSFAEQGNLFCVYENSETLQDKINQCIKEGGQFSNAFIWNVIHAVCSQLILVNPRPETKIKPGSIVFLTNDKIFLDVSETDPNEEDITSFDMGLPEPIYDAPEVITHNNPDCRAFVWSLGCILYELLGLEPAFFDIEGINPFQMYMNIVQGELPSFQNLNGSQELINLTLNCMSTDPELRPSLEYLLTLSMKHVTHSV